MCILRNCGPAQLSRYSVWLWAGLSGDRMQVEGRYFPHPSRPALGPTQPPIPGLSPWVNRPRRGVDHPPHLVSRLKREQSYTSTPPLGFRGLLYGEICLYLYLQETGHRIADSFNLDTSSVLWHRLVCKRLVSNQTSISSSDWMVVHRVTTNISDVMRATFPIIHFQAHSPKLRKAAVTSCLGCQWTGFHEI